MTQPRCSHLKLDDVATPACPFVLESVALYASVYACVSLCAQTERPPTDRGNATSWEGKWTTGRGRYVALNTCDIRDILCPSWCPSTIPIPLIVNDPWQNNWLPCPTQWWHYTRSDWLKMIPTQRSVFDAVPLAMQAYLYVGYGQRCVKCTSGQMRACVSPSLHSQLQCWYETKW